MKHIDRWQMAEKLIAGRERFAPASRVLERKPGSRIVLTDAAGYSTMLEYP